MGHGVASSSLDDRRASLDGLVGVICLPFELAFDVSHDALARPGYLHSLIERPFGLEPVFENSDTAKNIA